MPYKLDAMGRRPNIVWLFPDEWRYDAAGFAGNPVIQTPHLDALASRGTVFPRAYCEAPVCAPSRASLLSGSYARDHGKVNNGWDQGPFPPPEAPNFLHALRDAGYRTGQVGKMHFFDRLHEPEELAAYGLDDVAEEYDKIMLRRDFMDTPYTRYLDGLGLLDAWRAHQDEQTEIMFGRDPHGRRAVPEDLAHEHALDAFIGAQARRFVRAYADDDRPFFLWAAFVGPHIPFDGPPPFADRYDPDTIPLGDTTWRGAPDNDWGAHLRMVRDMFLCEQYDDADYRLMAKHYYASISLIDAQIGALVRTLEEVGLAEDTWIVLSSDHGELLGDHGLLTKGVFYETSVRVPVLVVPPAGRHLEQRVRDDLVQGFDVPATILDLAGADPGAFLGRSLLGQGPARDAVFSQITGFTMVATDRHKLVVANATHEPQALFDLVEDPDEERDVLGEPGRAPIVAALMETHVEPFFAGALVGGDAP